MKILFINTLDNLGGAAMVVSNLMGELRKLGVGCKLLVGYKRSRDINVGAINKLFGPDIDFFVNNGVNKIISNDIDSGASNEIFDHPWYREADIVHLNNLHGGYFKLDNLIRISKEKKIVWTFHDEWPIMAHGACVLNNRIENGFYIRDGLDTYPSMLFDNKNYLIKKKTKIYKNCEFVITVPSQWIKDLVEESILKDKNINLIHNGIDANYFGIKNKISVRKILGLPDNKKIILFVADGGITNTWKGWKYTQEMIDRGLPKDWLVVVVGGNNVGKTENIRFVGYVHDKKTLSQYYSAADVLIMPSIVESFGNVAVEAMSCGTPVVSFPVGVIPEIIKHRKNGYIAKYKDSTDLKQGIKWILGNKKSIDVEDLSKKIKSNFSIKNNTIGFLDIYKSILKND